MKRSNIVLALIVTTYPFLAVAQVEIYPSALWADSYSHGGKCYCSSPMDHGLGDKIVDSVFGRKTIRETCELVGSGPGRQGNPLYNDIQCGHGPTNGSWDEENCPGRVDSGTAGCLERGPKWSYQAANPVVSPAVSEPSAAQGSILPAGHTELDVSAAQSNGGVAYFLVLNQPGGDTMDSPQRSTLQLFENGKPLGPAHSLHADIRSSGQGRFSHWIDHLYFSASDSTNPAENERTYSYLIRTVDAANNASVPSPLPPSPRPPIPIPTPTPTLTPAPVVVAPVVSNPAPVTSRGLDARFNKLKIFPGAEGFGTD